MEKTISRKISVKASAAKPLDEPPFVNKNPDIEPVIRFYELEDGDDAGKGGESEILYIRDSSLMVSKKTM